MNKGFLRYWLYGLILVLLVIFCPRGVTPAAAHKHGPEAEAKAAQEWRGTFERLRKPSYIVDTVAGGGEDEIAGGSQLATDVKLTGAGGLSVAADGSYFVSDTWAGRILKATPDGYISTVFDRADGLLLNAKGDIPPITPTTVAATSNGGFLFVDDWSRRVWKVASDGSISAAAGGGNGWSTWKERRRAKRSKLAADLKLESPQGLAVLADNSFLVSDKLAHRIYRVTPEGTVSTVAGSRKLYYHQRWGLGVYSRGFSGDSKPARRALLDNPYGLATTSDGGYLIADRLNRRVRKVDFEDRISTVAGNGELRELDDLSVGSNGPIGEPTAVVDHVEGFYFADSCCVWWISSYSFIRHVAGDLVRGSGFSGDNGNAQSAQLNTPKGLGVLPNGDLLIADHGNGRVRRVRQGKVFPT